MKPMWVGVQNQWRNLEEVWVDVHQWRNLKQVWVGVQHQWRNLKQVWVSVHKLDHTMLRNDQNTASVERFHFSVRLVTDNSMQLFGQSPFNKQHRKTVFYLRFVFCFLMNQSNFQMWWSFSSGGQGLRQVWSDSPEICYSVKGNRVLQRQDIWT